MVLQDNYDKQTKEQKAQKEKLSILLETVSAENKELLSQLKQLRTQVYQFEYRLESGSLVRLQQDIQDLKNLQRIVLLETINRPEQSEKLLLDIVNNPNSTIPRDILILKLAQLSYGNNEFEESIAYYSTLLTEFPESPFFSQAIFEMSDNFAKTGKIKEQETLLLQLSTLSSLDVYSRMAVTKLEEMGVEPLALEDRQEIPLDENQDTTTDNAVQIEANKSPGEFSPTVSGFDGSVGLPSVTDGESLRISSDIKSNGNVEGTSVLNTDVLNDILPYYLSLKLPEVAIDVSKDSGVGETSVFEADVSNDILPDYVNLKLSDDATNDSSYSGVEETSVLETDVSNDILSGYISLKFPYDTTDDSIFSGVHNTQFPPAEPIGNSRKFLSPDTDISGDARSVLEDRDSSMDGPVRINVIPPIQPGLSDNDKHHHGRDTTSDNPAYN